MDPIQAIIQQQIVAGTFLQSAAAQPIVPETANHDNNEEEDEEPQDRRRGNILPTWGNKVTMNLNALVLENIRESYYYKNNLMEIDNFQTLVEQIFYQVKHLEPWEKGTRKLQGMTGMCGGVRGVGAGGVVSSAFCILYRLFNLKITRKQVYSMLNSRQSPYIRGIGFMYIRFTQPPADLWYWFEKYLDDDREIDPKSGGGDVQTFGELVNGMINKLDWYGTLFPRIPVPIQKDIDEKFAERKRNMMMEEEEEEDQWEGSAKTTGTGTSEIGKLPKVSKCKHHLRHHHCRKHRKKCPARQKRLLEKEKKEKESSAA